MYGVLHLLWLNDHDARQDLLFFSILIFIFWKIKSSQMITKLVLKLENIYGMLILLAVGLGGAIITLIGEMIVYKMGNNKEEVNGVIVI